jgi:hypothetical protein
LGLSEPHGRSPSQSDAVLAKDRLTSFKAVRFKIVCCRPVHFRITGAPSGQFGLTSMGTEFVAHPDGGTRRSDRRGF